MDTYWSCKIPCWKLSGWPLTWFEILVWEGLFGEEQLPKLARHEYSKGCYRPQQPLVQGGKGGSTSPHFWYVWALYQCGGCNWCGPTFLVISLIKYLACWWGQSPVTATQEADERGGMKGNQGGRRDVSKFGSSVWYFGTGQPVVWAGVGSGCSGEVVNCFVIETGLTVH